MNKIINALTFIISMTFLISCGKSDSCDSPGIAKTLTLSDSTKSLIANYENAERIVFTDEDGNEVIFDVRSIKETIRDYQILCVCDEDASETQIKVGTEQSISLVLSNFDEIPDSMFITLNEAILPQDIDDGENLWVGLVDENTQLDINLLRINPFRDFSGPIFQDSIIIRGKTFYSVFSQPDISSTRYDIKYSANQGIIFIKDRMSGRELVYERKE